MTKNSRITAAFAAALLAGGFLAGCGSSSSSAPSASTAQANQNNLSGREAAEFNAAVEYPYASAAPTNPLERENLAKRLLQYNSKGDTNYWYLLNMEGQPIGYYVINGKVSSTGSEMTSTQVNVDCGQNVTDGQSCTDDAIGDDGTYGPEEGGQNGVFAFTSTNALIETNDPFWVVSSQPIKLYASAPQLDAPATP